MRWKYESMDLCFDLRTQKLSEVLQDPRAKGPGTTRPRTSGRGPRAKGAGDAHPRTSGRGSRAKGAGDARPRASGRGPGGPRGRAAGGSMSKEYWNQ
jgi:hypothetical protein